MLWPSSCTIAAQRVSGSQIVFLPWRQTTRSMTLVIQVQGGCMRSGSRVVTVLAGLFLLASSFVWAQTGTTSLRGIVSDAKGAVVAGATVTIADRQNGLSRTVKSDGQGEYQFAQLPPATYTLTVSGAGFAALTQDKVELLV